MNVLAGTSPKEPHTIQHDEHIGRGRRRSLNEGCVLFLTGLDSSQGFCSHRSALLHRFHGMSFHDWIAVSN
eukprot:2183535-Amphidinium_carterae.1